MSIEPGTHMFDQSGLLEYKAEHGDWPHCFGEQGEIVMVVKRQPTAYEEQQATQFDTCPRCQGIKNNPQLWQIALDQVVDNFSQMVPLVVDDSGQIVSGTGQKCAVWFPPETPLLFWTKSLLHAWCINEEFENLFRQ
jgi:hypothetical protein